MVSVARKPLALFAAVAVLASAATSVAKPFIPLDEEPPPPPPEEIGPGDDATAPPPLEEPVAPRDYAQPPPGHQQHPFPQPPPPPPPAPVRKGFLLGGGLGFGSLTVSNDFGASDDYGSLFWAVHVGGMISPRMALLLEFWGASHPIDETDGIVGDELYQANAGAVGQFWVSKRWWLKAGLGTARVGVRGDGETLSSARGVAALIAGGFEVLHRPRYAIDIALRLTIAGYKADDDGTSTDSTGLQASFTWF